MWSSCGLVSSFTSDWQSQAAEAATHAHAHTQTHTRTHTGRFTWYFLPTPPLSTHATPTTWLAGIAAKRKLPRPVTGIENKTQQPLSRLILLSPFLAPDGGCLGKLAPGFDHLFFSVCAVISSPKSLCFSLWTSDDAPRLDTVVRLSVCVSLSAAGGTAFSFRPSDCQESTWPTVSSPLYALHPASHRPASTG